MDYISLVIQDADIERLINLKELNFISGFSESTGEILSKKIAEYHFCKIIIDEDRLVRFKGSIHKMYNSIKGVEAQTNRFRTKDRGFNGNLFTVEHNLKAICHLEYLFNCSSSNMKIKSIEFGINSETEFNPKKYIRGLLCHSNIEFEHKFRRNFAHVVHDRFSIKIYSKSYQYQLKNNIVRVELKIKKMIELKSVGLTTLNDFNEDTYYLLSNMLLNRLDQVLHYDYSIDINKLNKTTSKLINKYQNSQFWTEE